jgi:hypothetical protein
MLYSVHAQVHEHGVHVRDVHVNNIHDTLQEQEHERE